MTVIIKPFVLDDFCNIIAVFINHVIAVFIIHILDVFQIYHIVEISGVVREIDMLVVNTGIYDRNGDIGVAHGSMPCVVCAYSIVHPLIALCIGAFAGRIERIFVLE